MGKAFEDKKDHAQAFEHYKKGNETYSQEINYNADLNYKRIQSLKKQFTREFFDARADSGSHRHDPIFIVGLPRSGSTLLEQILSSHSAVEGTTELPDIISMAKVLREEAGSAEIAVFAEVLDTHGELADASALVAFADAHDLSVGRVTDLVDYRLNHSRTVDLIRSGQITTRHGEFMLSVYQESTQGHVHMALSKGEFDQETPTLVRVHTVSSVRDLLAVSLAERASWSIQDSLSRVGLEGGGVVVLINKQESDAELLAQVDAVLGADLPDDSQQKSVGYSQVGMGAQILRDLGVGKIRLMGAPVKYNALEGFGLEVVEFVEPEAMPLA